MVAKPKVHMMALGGKTACGKKKTKDMDAVPISRGAYKHVTCKACKRRIKSIVGF